MANAAPGANPYAGPKAAVGDAAEPYQDVKVFSVSGRIGRVRYIAWGMGLYFVFAMLGALLAMAIGVAGMVVAWAVIIVMWFMLTIQRCHDFNTTGWLSILVLVPLVNLIFWFIPGTDGENKYGAKTPPNGVGVILAACIVPIIAVIGILAAIAIPAYQDYTKRAQQKMQMQKAPTPAPQQR